MFGISNIFIASAVNTFPTTTVTANTIAGNIDALTYIAMNSYSQASMTFTGQNYGALKPDRIKKSVLYSFIQVISVGAIISGLEIICIDPLINLYLDHSNPDTAVIIEVAKELAIMLLVTYIICGVMEVFSGAAKGMGYVMGPMLVTIGCICGLRILWIIFVFPYEAFNSIMGLYITYPISWSAALIGMLVVFRLAYADAKRLSISHNEKIEEKSGTAE
jgi:Na+-driven multidrug efflux pump